jgi:fucose 4-O-acetylase-like acetyltransferase
VQEATRAALLGPFFTVNRSLFMSLFFMISGYFMVGAYERSGPRDFVLGRLRRLGIPVLVFAVLMLLARIFLFGEKIGSWLEVFNAGHLWYLEHLLLFAWSTRCSAGSGAPARERTWAGGLFLGSWPCWPSPWGWPSARRW